MKPTVLIVDDVPSLRAELRAMLEGEFKVLGEVADGLAAIDACKRLQPSLVVMDVVMPKMSGIDATRVILSQTGIKPKILMLSGLKDEMVVLRALEAGASDYLFKPIQAAKLCQILKSFLTKAA